MAVTRELIHKANNLRYYKETYFNRANCKISFYYEYYSVDDKDIISKLHNTHNKPAVIHYSSGKITKLEYWIKGKKDRLNAPAIITINGKEIYSEEWYHNGVKLSDVEIEQIKKVLERRKKIMKLVMKTLQKKRLNENK